MSLIQMPVWSRLNFQSTVCYLDKQTIRNSNKKEWDKNENAKSF